MHELQLTKANHLMLVANCVSQGNSDLAGLIQERVHRTNGIVTRSNWKTVIISSITCSLCLYFLDTSNNKIAFTSCLLERVNCDFKLLKFS
jgi:hypothetical protein